MSALTMTLYPRLSFEEQEEVFAALHRAVSPAVLLPRSLGEDRTPCALSSCEEADSGLRAFPVAA